MGYKRLNEVLSDKEFDVIESRVAKKLLDKYGVFGICDVPIDLYKLEVNKVRIEVMQDYIRDKING
ncbi:MAG: hypothetical protein RSC24_06245 [Clostridium sp.]